MITVGMVSEDKYDSEAIRNLIHINYRNRVSFKPIATRLKGDQLNSAKAKRVLSTEFVIHKCDFFIFIRDSDGLPSQEDKIKEKTDWFRSVNEICGGKNIFLLNIWELETMIFSDIEVFNKKYKTELRGDRNPMYIPDPKAELLRATYRAKRRFAESDCPEIFKELSFDKVKTKCHFFSQFVDNLDAKLKT